VINVTINNCLRYKIFNIMTLPNDTKHVTNWAYKSYCSTVNFRRITSIYQPTNAHIVSHKTHLKHSDMFRSCQIIIREVYSFLKLYYRINNSCSLMMIWQDRKMSECFKVFSSVLNVFYVKLYVHSLIDELKKFSLLSKVVFHDVSNN